MELTYSQVYKHSLYQCHISPDKKYVANTTSTTVVIRDHSHDMVVMHVYETNYAIDWMCWSPNAQYIATINRERAVANIWSVNDTNWKVTFTDRRFGMQHAWWSPDSSSLLVTSDLHLKMTIWMFTRNKIKYIMDPKFVDRGCAVSPDGKYVAVVVKKESRDYLNIFDSKSYELLQQISLDLTDVVTVQWSPDSLFLVAYDTSLYYKLLVYRLDGELAFSYSAYDYGLGIKCITWHDQLLAIGSYDGKVRLINTGSWQLVTTLSHLSNIKPREFRNMIIYEEYDLPNMKNPTLETKVGYRVIARRPLQLPALRPEHVHDPSIGIGVCQFSTDGSLLATKCDSMPNVLWIWDVHKLEICLIITQKNPIRQISWNPKYAHILAIACGTENVYLVYEDKAIHNTTTTHFKTSDILKIIPVSVPTSKYSVRKIEWSLDGETLLLLDHQLYCLASFYILH